MKGWRWKHIYQWVCFHCIKLLARTFNPSEVSWLHIEQIEHISERPGPSAAPWEQESESIWRWGQQRTEKPNYFFILFCVERERLSLVRKGEMRKANFRIMRCWNMGKIVGGIKYKLQKEMLKMRKCEWVHKKNERMLKKKKRRGEKWRERGPRQAEAGQRRKGCFCWKGGENLPRITFFAVMQPFKRGTGSERE